MRNNNRSSAFTVGRSEAMIVESRGASRRPCDGRQIRSSDISTGKPGWRPATAANVIMEKVRKQVWTNASIDAPEHYHLKSKDAMRIMMVGR